MAREAGADHVAELRGVLALPYLSRWPHGEPLGDAIALMKTSARSPYFFSFHKRDIGHTLIVGPTGGGKTVIVNFLMAQAEKTGARQIFVDKDRGAQIFVLASVAPI
jgi:type IV secretion system protein VirB4